MRKLKLLLLASVYCLPAQAAEQLIIKLTVNGVVQGDVSAIYDQGGYWLEAAAIKASGINTLDGEQQIFAGSVFFRADRLIGIESKMNEAELSLSLNAAASEFGERQINLNRNRSELFPQAAPFSWYLNYQIAAFSQSNTSDLNYQLSPTVNMNQGAWNFRSAQSFNTQNSEQRWTRLSTTVDYDLPEKMLRASFGDISPSAGALGFSQSLAGLSLSRVFNMQPNFNSSPGLSTQASVTQPSTAEIYLNGQRVSTQNLQPGIYNFNELSFFSGLQNVEIIIRDAAGNTQRISVPFYFDDSLLKAGLSEFNYSAGLARQSGSFDQYQDFTYSAYQRVGITDWLTLGAQTSGGKDRNSRGILANLGLATYGTLATAFSWAHHDQQERGAAQLLQYRFINQVFSVSANARRQDKDFLKRSAVLMAPDWSANVGLGWGNNQIGNLSVDIGRQVGNSDALTFNRYMLGYAVSPFKQMSVSAQAQLQERTSGQTWYGFLNFSWFFDGGKNLYSSARYQNKQTLVGANFGQNAPTGEGWGYNFGVQQQEDGKDYITWVQNKRQHGQIDLSMMRNDNSISSSSNWQATWSGALAYAGGHYALTRPITQSFAVVELPEVAAVGVLHNASQVGFTDEHGLVFLPDLANYGFHQIGLEQNDIPIHYRLDQLQKETLTGNNDGRVVRFEARQVAAVSGRFMRADGRPLANQLIKVETDAEFVLLHTALDGRFYSESLTAGRYRFSSELCHGELLIPQSIEVITELAPITCSEKAS